MKIFALADIHGDFGIIDRIKNELTDHDLITVSGDLTNFNSVKVATAMTYAIEGLSSLLIVPGNCDIPEILSLFEEENISLHGRGRSFGKIGFFGAGGSTITPFDTPFEISEAAMNKFLMAGYSQLAGCDIKIMVTHSPPFGTKIDTTGKGDHGGSEAVYEFIKRHDVDLLLCGHIHEARGEDVVAGTPVLNIGPSHVGYVEVEIDDKVSYEFVDF